MTVLFEKMMDLELIVLNLRGQLQCRMGETRGPVRSLPEVLESESSSGRYRRNLRITTWTKAELQMILERHVLPAIIPEFSTFKRMTLRMNSPMLVPSLQAIEVMERQQRVITHG